jgi:AraC-like DNA-binding protein
MKLYLKCDMNIAYKKILQEQLDKFQLNYNIMGFGDVEINDDLPNDKLKQLNNCLNTYGIEIVESHKSILVQKIKDVIVEMVYMDDKLPISKISSYLADKLNYRYGYISNLFSEVTYTTIENFIILQKTERAKQLIITNELTITEIAWKLSYSSLAHFSNQFKGTTGLTPTAFQRIINKRRTIESKNKT